MALVTQATVSPSPAEACCCQWLFHYFLLLTGQKKIHCAWTMKGSEVNPARVAPPKPMPYLPQRPPIEPLTHHAPSNGPPSTKPGKKLPLSVPPPPPPRVDLGETTVDVSSSIKEQSNIDLAQKGSPKPKYEINLFLCVYLSIT